MQARAVMVIKGSTTIWKYKFKQGNRQDHLFAIFLPDGRSKKLFICHCLHSSESSCPMKLSDQPSHRLYFDSKQPTWSFKSSPVEIRLWFHVVQCSSGAADGLGPLLSCSWLFCSSLCLRIWLAGFCQKIWQPECLALPLGLLDLHTVDFNTWRRVTHLRD